jgi:hypothetical protein
VSRLTDAQHVLELLSNRPSLNGPLSPLSNDMCLKFLSKLCALHIGTAASLMRFVKGKGDDEDDHLSGQQVAEHLSS